VTVTTDVAAEAGAMIGAAVVVPVVTIVVEVVEVQEMEAEVGAMMIVVRSVGRSNLLKVLS
jgi:nucleotide-binding universal stress UspA family protein